MVMSFLSKADTLAQLESQLTHATVLPQVSFTVSSWRAEEHDILGNVDAKGWMNEALIVRSSASAEDNNNASLAGHFQSVLNVMGLDAIREAIQTVIKSFGQVDCENEQIFIQPMLEDVAISGVAFSKDPNTGSDYYVINFDDTSGDTDSITSGSSNIAKTHYCYKHQKLHDEFTQKIINLLRELELHFQHDALDIEFAIDSQSQLHLLQVRRLIMDVDDNIVDQNTVTSALQSIHKKIKAFNKPHPYLHGERTIFGSMPDWNPAEIIGVRPRPLALSLYKELITDNIWAYQRDNYGYKNLRSFPLLVDFHGLPYIDVRVSFNSFIPAEIDSDLSEKLVNYYINKLIASPCRHDKVEFDIIFSCYTLDLPERVTVLKEYGFTDAECDNLTNSLRNLTNRIIHGEKGLWLTDIKKIDELKARRLKILNSDLAKIEKIYWLLEDCKRYGTLPFAGLARAGFIAVQILHSMINVDIINQQEYNSFLAELTTVSSKLTEDFQNLSQQGFLQEYGHLRPGTYDITSKRYDEAADTYFNWEQQTKPKNDEQNRGFKLSLTQMKKTENLLKTHQLDHDVIGLFDFFKSVIEGREYAKFEFTRSLSDAMSLFKEIAGEYGYTAEQASYANIDLIKHCYASCDEFKALFADAVTHGKEKFQLTKAICLPPLIDHADQVYSFRIPTSSPNFITQNKIAAEVKFVDNSHNISGCIVMIPAADPGYDWIFSHDIAGLVTMYGGVNSHMAIRAGELNIPAVIGAGETLYEQWAKARILEINCENKQVIILQ